MKKFVQVCNGGNRVRSRVATLCQVGVAICLAAVWSMPRDYQQQLCSGSLEQATFVVPVGGQKWTDVFGNSIGTTFCLRMQQ